MKQNEMFKILRRQCTTFSFFHESYHETFICFISFDRHAIHKCRLLFKNVIETEIDFYTWGKGHQTRLAALVLPAAVMCQNRAKMQ